MAKRGFILSSNFNIIVTYKWKTKLAKDIGQIFNYNIEQEKDYVLKSTVYSLQCQHELRQIIKQYLAERNMDEPDYGISWRQSFKREQVFTNFKVLGEMMELYCGNEDATIRFLANMDNTFKLNDEVMLFGAMNQGVYDFLEGKKKSITVDKK